MAAQDLVRRHRSLAPAPEGLYDQKPELVVTDLVTSNIVRTSKKRARSQFSEADWSSSLVFNVPATRPATSSVDYTLQVPKEVMDIFNERVFSRQRPNHIGGSEMQVVSKHVCLQWDTVERPGANFTLFTHKDNFVNLTSLIDKGVPFHLFQSFGPNDWRWTGEYECPAGIKTISVNQYNALNELEKAKVYSVLLSRIKKWKYFKDWGFSEAIITTREKLDKELATNKKIVIEYADLSCVGFDMTDYHIWAEERRKNPKAAKEISKNLKVAKKQTTPKKPSKAKTAKKPTKAK